MKDSHNFFALILSLYDIYTLYFHNNCHTLLKTSSFNLKSNVALKSSTKSLWGSSLVTSFTLSTTSRRRNRSKSDLPRPAEIIIQCSQNFFNYVVGAWHPTLLQHITLSTLYQSTHNFMGTVVSLTGKPHLLPRPPLLSSICGLKSSSVALISHFIQSCRSPLSRQPNRSRTSNTSETSTNIALARGST